MPASHKLLFTTIIKLWYTIVLFIGTVVSLDNFEPYVNASICKQYPYEDLDAHVDIPEYANLNGEQCTVNLTLTNCRGGKKDIVLIATSDKSTIRREQFPETKPKNTERFYHISSLKATTNRGCHFTLLFMQLWLTVDNTRLSYIVTLGSDRRASEAPWKISKKHLDIDSKLRTKKIAPGVWVACNLDRYGRECEVPCVCTMGLGHATKPCYENAKSKMCAQSSGRCHLRYRGPNCNTFCNFTSFGDGCKQRCFCQSEYGCNAIHGVCHTENCQLGYYSPQCNKKCERNMFALTENAGSCLGKCHCLQSSECNAQTGVCTGRECERGFKKFEDGRCYDESCGYGSDCAKKCHCADGAICDRKTGRCRNKCSAGYTGDDCQEMILDSPTIENNAESDYDFIEGQTFAVVCVSNRIESEIIMKWLRGGIVITPGNYFGISETRRSKSEKTTYSKLTIKGITWLNDKMTLECRIHQKGYPQSRRSTATPAISVAYQLYATEKRTLRKGSILHLPCPIPTGDNAVSLAWSKDGKTLTGNKVYTKMNFNKEDVGRYECAAMHKRKRRTYVFQMRLPSDPVVSMPDVHVVHCTTTILRCRIKSETKLISAKILDHTNTTMTDVTSNYTDQIVLQFKIAGPKNHTALYTCIAKNMDGSSMDTAYLTILCIPLQSTTVRLSAEIKEKSARIWLPIVVCAVVIACGISVSLLLRKKIRTGGSASFGDWWRDLLGRNKSSKPASSKGSSNQTNPGGSQKPASPGSDRLKDGHLRADHIKINDVGSKRSKKTKASVSAVKTRQQERK